MEKIERIINSDRLHVKNTRKIGQEGTTSKRHEN